MARRSNSRIRALFSNIQHRRMIAPTDEGAMFSSSLSHLPEPPLTPSYSRLVPPPPPPHTRGLPGSIHREQEEANETTRRHHLPTVSFLI